MPDIGMDSALQCLYDVQISDVSTTHAPLLGGFQSFQEVSDVPMIDRSHIREEIKRNLKLDGLLVPAAKEVLDGEKNVEEVARNRLLEPSLLKLKMDIMQEKKHYWKVKDKIEEAVKPVFFFSELTNYEILIEFAATKLGVSATVFTDEFNKYKSLNDKTLYEYEKLSANMEGDFTYKEESFLLQRMRSLKDYLRCFCKVCVLECLRSLAYDFAQLENKKCYSEWSKHENSNLKWLFLFMIGYTDEISIFDSPRSCKIEPRASTNVLQSSLSSDQ